MRGNSEVADEHEAGEYRNFTTHRANRLASVLPGVTINNPSIPVSLPPGILR